MRQVSLPLCGFGDLFDYGVAFEEKSSHVATQDGHFGDAAKNWERGGEAEDVFHLGGAGGQGSKVMIVLHGVEGAVNHRVLEVGGWLQGSDFAG